MGFWNKLGKIALQAAPYVAAPFTGGASLMATGATQKLGQKWAEHDAKKAIEKGLAPSKFDKYLGMASTAAGLGSSFTGGFGLGSLGSKAASTGSKVASAAGAAGKAAKTANALSGWQKNLATAGKVGSLMMGAAPMGQGTEAANAPGNGLGGWQGQLAGIAGDVLRSSTTPSNPTPTEVASSTGDTRASGYVNGFPVNAGQARPRGTSIIDMGRNAALMSQPWRTGYDVRSEGPDDAEGNPQVITTKNPAIYPNYNPPVQSPPVSENGNQSGSIFGDQLTQRYGAARKRNPAPVEEEY